MTPLLAAAAGFAAHVCPRGSWIVFRLPQMLAKRVYERTISLLRSLGPLSGIALRDTLEPCDAWERLSATCVAVAVHQDRATSQARGAFLTKVTARTHLENL